MSRLAAQLGLVAMILGAVIYAMAAVWGECREDHSVLYCVMVMSK
jgi:hypothetical protein